MLTHVRNTMSAIATAMALQTALHNVDLASDPCLQLLYHCSLGKTTVADAVAHAERLQPACTRTLRAFLHRVAATT